MNRLSMKPHADGWTKHGVVLAPSEAWEGTSISNFQACAEPLGEGHWRLWYSSCNHADIPFNIAVAEGKPGEAMVRTPAVLSSGPPADAPLALGNFPEGWGPTQPVCLRLQDGSWRLYFWAHGPGVVRFLAAESRDGRRFSVIDPARPCLYHPLDRAVDFPAIPKSLITVQGGSTRPSGEPIASPDLICNDATSVYQLPDGSFELYTVHLILVGPEDPRFIAHDNAPGCVRIIKRYTSKDGLQWGAPQCVITPDESDPKDLQFYHLTVTHTPQGRVGLLGYYRVEAQTMDLQACFSNDGVHWVRAKQAAWLERGESGEPDSWAIYPPNRLVNSEGRWWLFYTAMNYSHNLVHHDGAPCSKLMLASRETLP